MTRGDKVMVAPTATGAALLENLLLTHTGVLSVVMVAGFPLLVLTITSVREGEGQIAARMKVAKGRTI